MATIVYIITEWTAANWHLRGQLAYMRAQGHRVVLVTSGPEARLEKLREREGVEVVGLEMSREIDPSIDVRSLTALVRLLTRVRPDVVNASTPKAGLLGMMAARIVGVPTRIYLLRGLRLETTTGLKRAILWGCEFVSMRCAHQVICVSDSLRERAGELALLPSGQGRVLGNGSSNGLEAGRFAASEQTLARARELRREYGVPDDALVIGFVGRMTRDKGIDELLSVFGELALRRSNVYLLLVGNFEDGDPVSDSARAVCEEHDRILHTGFVSEPAPYYHAMDLLVFPSWREGMPNVPLQAAASSLPVVAFDATGSRDAVVAGRTGALVSIGDEEGLSDAIERYLDDPVLREAHGAAGREWVSEVFSPELVWSEMARVYDDSIKV